MILIKKVKRTPSSDGMLTTTEVHYADGNADRSIKTIQPVDPDFASAYHRAGEVIMGVLGVDVDEHAVKQIQFSGIGGIHVAATVEAWTPYPGGLVTIKTPAVPTFSLEQHQAGAEKLFQDLSAHAARFIGGRRAQTDMFDRAPVEVTVTTA